MAPQYDRQLIIGLERDEIIYSTATNLALKNQFVPKFRSQILWLDRVTSIAPTVPKKLRDAPSRAGVDAGRSFAELRAAIEQLTPDSRLYLIGHGDDTHQSVGGWSARELAQLLCAAGLRQVKTVSLVSCGAAGNPAVQWDQNETAHTFASQLATIFSHNEVETQLYARCYRVGVHAFQERYADWENPQEKIPTGQKFAFRKRTRATEADPFVHKRQHSKIMYRISKDTSEASWVDYPDAHGMDPVGFNE